MLSVFIILRETTKFGKFFGIESLLKCFGTILFVCIELLIINAS